MILFVQGSLQMSGQYVAKHLNTSIQKSVSQLDD
jgi:hypothetical protein